MNGWGGEEGEAEKRRRESQTAEPVKSDTPEATERDSKQRPPVAKFVQRNPFKEIVDAVFPAAIRIIEMLLWIDVLFGSCLSFIWIHDELKDAKSTWQENTVYTRFILMRITVLCVAISFSVLIRLHLLPIRKSKS